MSQRLLGQSSKIQFWRMLGCTMGQRPRDKKGLAPAPPSVNVPPITSFPWPRLLQQKTQPVTTIHQALEHFPQQHRIHYKLQ
jgi:hypothetical protein